MKLGAIFTDNMLLQRDIPIKVFGTGDGVAKISFRGETVTAKSVDGKWCASLKPCRAGGPYSMEIDLDGEVITLRDILMGDVYIAGGQSNMEMPLFKTDQGFEEAKHCANDNIRYYTVPRRYKPGSDNTSWHFVDMRTCDMPWAKCDEESALNFTAIGHYFAKFINEATDVPVGIISCNWGGRRIEPFIPKEYFYESDVLKAQMEEFEAYVSGLNMDEYEEKYKEFEKAIDRFVTEKKSGHMEFTRRVGLRASSPHTLVSDMPYPERGPYDSVSPSTLWNSMFETIVPYGIKGLLWYQGESNGMELDYTEKYLIFLKALRERFGCDIDAYAVELAPWMGDIPSYMQQPMDRFVTENNWAFLREQQQKATEIGERNYLATTMELGDSYDIHPLNKRDVAYRLAIKAMKYTYDMDVKADQPLYDSVEFIGGKAYITLRHGEGLYGVTDAVNMYIAGADKVLHRAKVEIQDDGRLCVYSQDVPEPVLVRYAFDTNYFGQHLYNDAGLPLAPFRTDKF